ASAGDYWATGFNDRLTDAVAAVAWLASRPVVDASRIFVLGHSEGALVAIRLASGAAPIAGAVLLAGSAKTGEQTLLWQGGEIAKTLTGFNKWLVAALHIDPQASQRKYIAGLKATTGEVARIQLVQKINAKWMREFLSYDPAVDLVRTKIPILAITGSRDIQVDPADLELMAGLLPGDFESHLVPDVTHLLRADPGGLGLKSYKRQVERPVDERVVGYIRDWLLSKAGAPRADHHTG
ncbi:MAG: alpha/beta fold hydrolase, partial [Candidatus Dormiibacterota bacterium]